MLKAAAISFIVSHVERHRVSFGTEDRWLIHIVPGAVQVGSPMEILQVVLASPKLLSIRV